MLVDSDVTPLSSRIVKTARSVKSASDGCADVEPAEVEAPEALRDRVEGGFEGRGNQVGRVEEDRAAAVAANLDERHGLAARGDAMELGSMDARVDVRQADRALVGKDQLLERGASVAAHRRKAFLGDRKDAAPALVRVPVVEDAELMSSNCTPGR